MPESGESTDLRLQPGDRIEELQDQVLQRLNDLNTQIQTLLHSVAEASRPSAEETKTSIPS